MESRAGRGRAMQHCCQQQHQHVAFMKSFYLLGLMLATHKWARGVAGLSQKALFGSNIVRHGYMPTECATERECERAKESDCSVATANRVVTLSVINACDIFIITSLYFVRSARSFG